MDVEGGATEGGQLPWVATSKKVEVNRAEGSGSHSSITIQLFFLNNSTDIATFKILETHK